MRDNSFARSRVDGPRRIYPLEQIDDGLGRFRGFWTHKLEALATEVARGKKERWE